MFGGLLERVLGLRRGGRGLLRRLSGGERLRYRGGVFLPPPPHRGGALLPIAGDILRIGKGRGFGSNTGAAVIS